MVVVWQECHIPMKLSNFVTVAFWRSNMDTNVVGSSPKMRKFLISEDYSFVYWYVWFTFKCLCVYRRSAGWYSWNELHLHSESVLVTSTLWMRTYAKNMLLPFHQDQKCRNDISAGRVTSPKGTGVECKIQTGFCMRSELSVKMCKPEVVCLANQIGPRSLSQKQKRSDRKVNILGKCRLFSGFTALSQYYYSLLTSPLKVSFS